MTSTPDMLKSMYSQAISVLEPTDLVIFLRQGMLDSGFFRFNKAEMHQTMKTWRKSVKKGELEILLCNNKTVTTFDGKTWYMLVVQPTDKIDEVAWCDPAGVHLLGELVDGWIYMFRSEANRDAIQKYVMGVLTPHLD